MLWPSEVLPTPGGPTKHRIGLLPSGLSLRTARYSRMRRLIFVEAEVVLVEDAARLVDVDRLLRPAAPTAARRASRGRCAPSSTRATARTCARGASAPCARASRLPRASSPSSICFAQLLDLGRRALVVAELLLDRLHLLAQQRLALARLRGGPASARRSRATAQHLDALRHQREHAVEPRLHVEGLEERPASRRA